MSIRPRTLYSLTALLALAILVVLWIRDPASQHTSEARITSDVKISSPLPGKAHKDPARVMSAQAFLLALGATSLEGTQPPGKFEVDASGQLVVDSTSRDIMDYFLALAGEMPDEEIRKLLIQWAAQDHGWQVGMQCASLFDRYREWLKRFSSGEFAASTQSDVRAQLQEKHRVRDEILGPEWSASLYADEDTYDRFSLARMDVLQADLTRDEREQALLQLEATLPERMALAYQQQRALQSLAKTESELRDKGASDTDLYQYRQETFGDAAAERLSALDEQRANWERRYQQYQQQKALILTSGLAPSDQQQAISDLQASLFDATETLRVQAMDRLGSNPGA